jgi:hypothetical protein
VFPLSRFSETTDRVARLTASAPVVAVLVAGIGATGSATSAQQADTVAGTQVDPDDVHLESRIVVWNGPVDFGANELTLVVSEQATGDVATTATGDGGDAGGGTGDAGGGGGGLPLGTIAALGVVIAVAAGVLYRQQGGGSSADGPGSSTGAGDAPGGTDGDAAVPSDAPESSASASEDGGGTAAESAGVADADAPDPEADPTDDGGDGAGAAAVGFDLLAVAGVRVSLLVPSATGYLLTHVIAYYSSLQITEVQAQPLDPEFDVRANPLRLATLSIPGALVLLPAVSVVGD